MQEEQQAEDAALCIGRAALQKALTLCVVIVAGLLYNLHGGTDALARRFAPMGLPLMFGYFAIGVILLAAVWVGLRLCWLAAKPECVAKADAAGLHLKRIGLVPWADVLDVWQGSPYCARPERFGQCLYVRLDMSFAAEAASQLHGIGYLADKAVLDGEGVRLRFWAPFVPFAKKEAFYAAITQFKPIEPNLNLTVHCISGK